MPSLELPTGVELHYERTGTRHGATIVFVNSPWLDAGAWREVERQCAGRYATMRYDCRGQGRSGRPAGPYAPHQHAADLQALLSSLELEAVHLVGSGSGGLAAIIAAGELSKGETQSVLSVSTIGAFVGVDPVLRSILSSWKAALLAGGASLWIEVAAPWLWGRTFLTSGHGEVELHRGAAAAADPADLQAHLDGLIEFADARRSLRTFGSPLLAAVGQDDLLTPIRYSHEIVEWARNGLLVTIEQAGHLALVESPGAISRLILGFIDRHAGADPSEAPS